jgi:hypothetical protein
MEKFGIVNALINVLTLFLIGGIGWLIKRAFAGIDERVAELGRKAEKSGDALAQLALLVAGNYVTRNEAVETEKRLESLINQCKKDIHNLRDEVGPIATKVATLEGRSNHTRQRKGDDK